MEMNNTIYPVLENSVDIVTQRWSKGAEVWHGRPVLHGTTVPPPAAPKKKIQASSYSVYWSRPGLDGGPNMRITWIEDWTDEHRTGPV